ncbi:hypothetical protein AKJ48_03205, partial [candidate division MSBL1 archaeon SCGC-AAA261O19]
MFYVVLVTVGEDSRAREIGRKLVEEKLAACANVISGVNSTYRWKGKVEEIQDVAAMVKSKNIAIFPFAHLSGKLASP